MISLVTGTVRSLSSEKVVIEVGGVGLSVFITPQSSTSLALGAHCQLFTTMIVREDSLTLFGFLEDESRALFELLQTVSGIGPKVALAVLGSLSPEQLSLAIAQENHSAIEKVPGIGKKGAQRLVLELKGKVENLGYQGAAVTHQPAWREQLTSALISLGFSAKESDNSINELLQSLNGASADEMELSELLKLALQSGKR